MLQNPCKTLGFMKTWSTKFPLGGGKPYPASGLIISSQFLGAIFVYTHVIPNKHTEKVKSKVKRPLSIIYKEHFIILTITCNTATLIHF